MNVETTLCTSGVNKSRGYSQVQAPRSLMTFLHPFNSFINSSSSSKSFSSDSLMSSKEWVDEWMTEGISEWMNEWVSEWVNEWMDEEMNERLTEWVSEWMNEWVNEWIDWVPLSCLTATSVLPGLPQISSASHWVTLAKFPWPSSCTFFSLRKG